MKVVASFIFLIVLFVVVFSNLDYFEGDLVAVDHGRCRLLAKETSGPNCTENNWRALLIDCGEQLIVNASRYFEKFYFYHFKKKRPEQNENLDFVS